MIEMPTTIVISDLHLGGGKKNDPGDDHVDDKQQLVRFLGEISREKDGPAELFINGDFLEFAQVLPEAYALRSPKYWCSEAESLAKLEVIISGHGDIFEALKEFQRRGNRVTVAPGNHDVDLYWLGVRKRLRAAAGPLKFELRKTLCSRYDGRLLIGHGHMYDPANSFRNWKQPVLDDAPGGPRLEMCPGTLFIVEFVNWLDQRYPFSDNIKPVSALIRMLWNEQRHDFWAAARTLAQFIKHSPSSALGSAPISIEGDSNIARSIKIELATNKAFAKSMAQLYRMTRDVKTNSQQVVQDLGSKEDITEFLGEVIARVSPDIWVPIIKVAIQSGTLSVARAAARSSKERDLLREEAIVQLMEEGQEVVVFGHTHQPDEWRGSQNKLDGGYFNPGSWTRYVDLDKINSNKNHPLTIDDLKDETDFPYQLNYIRIVAPRRGKLRADKICFDEADGTRFASTPRPLLRH